MPLVRDLINRVSTLFRLGAAERELKEEFAFHVEMETQKLIDAGHTPTDAAREAARRFGGATREAQRTRDEWGIGLVRDLASDARHALCQFRRRPAYSIIGTLTLALGIGATVSLLSAVRGTLLTPMPVADEQRLHVFWSDFNWRGVEFDFLKEHVRAFDGIAAYTINGITLGADDGNVTVLSGDVSAELFDVVGRPAARGRTFATGADRPGAAAEVVISHRLWERQFASDPTILGRRVTLAGVPTTVIGVMPRGFYYPTPEVELWRPLNLDPSTQLYQGTGWLVVIGRAKPGASAADVQRNIDEMATALGGRFTYPAAWDKTKNAHTTLVREYAMGNVRPAMLLLMGAVVALLLMACANVAALVLSRTTDRTPELALRTALGAGRGRLVRQIVAESLVLSLVAGILGAVIAAVSYGVLVRSLPLRDGLATTLAINWQMFASAVVVSCMVGFAVAAIPVRSLLRGELHGISGERSAPALRRRNRGAHAALVTAEISLGVLLAAGALLLVRSVSQLYDRELGFDANGVVALDLITPPNEMNADVRRQFYRDVVTAVSALPGVSHAGLVSRLPVRDGGGQGTLQSASRPDISRENAPNSFNRTVTPDYFRTMGISIVRGRGFTDIDRQGAPLAAVVSESFAKRFWPDADPIGQQVAAAGVAQPVWITVVGVAEESRMFRMVGENPLVLYLAAEQMGSPSGFVLVAKTSGDVGALTGAIRRAVRAVDRRVAIARVTTMEDAVAASMSDKLQLRLFLSLFAALAIALGAIGVYGVVSYAVSRRRAEFGVRMALGATSERVWRDVVSDGLAPVVLGVVVGVALTLPLTRVVRGFLYEVQPTDAVSLAGAAGALLAAGTLAVIVPAIRAGRTSPVEVLRGD